MKRMIWALSFAMACSVTAAGQTPSADTATSDKKAMKSGPVTVTGCVAEASAGQYTLTNATLDSGKMAAEKMATDKVPADKMDHSAMTTYRLSGGTDLKAHVGHKVAVTGTLGKMDHSATGATAPAATSATSATAATAGTAATATADMATKSGMLTVTSVKMISATCP